MRPARQPDQVFRDLVIARIVEPTSLRDAGQVLTDLGQRPASEKTLRRTLLRCAAGRFRDRVAELCFAHAIDTGRQAILNALNKRESQALSE